MFTIWTVLGRAALDGNYRDALTKLAIRNDLNKSLMTNLQDRGYHISLFEVWDLSRFLSRDSQEKKPLLPQIESIYKSFADPKSGTPSPEFCAIIGVSMIDRKVALEIDGKKGDRPKLDRFLTRDPLHFQISYIETQLIAHMFSNPDMYKLCELFNGNNWEDSCEEGCIYDPKYDSLHPTGPDVSAAGSWFNLTWLAHLLDQDDILRALALRNNARLLKHCAADPAILPKLQEIVCPTCLPPAPHPGHKPKKKAKKAGGKKV